MNRDPFARPEELIRRVYSYVAYRIGAGSDAEDVTSETMLRAVRRRSTYDPSRGKPISWLIGIARTCVADHFSAAHPTAHELEDGPSAENLEVETVERLTIADAVARLDPRDRELVALRYGADLSTKEVAALLGLTPNAVDVALHRCRGRLRSELDGASTSRTRPVVARPTTEPSL
jgi:RNA polymerase sigma-70 factor (ECF subfamily)